MARSKITLVLIVMICASHAVSSEAQVTATSPKTAVQPPNLPITTQIKKTIVFIESDCLHNFNNDLPNLSREKLLQMPPSKQLEILNQTNSFIRKLRLVKLSNEKLTVEKSSRSLPTAQVSPSIAIDVPSEIESTLRTLIEMTALTDAELKSMSDLDLSLLPVDTVRGTGFLVSYTDPRIKPEPGQAGTLEFRYLVTNRHVVQPGIEKGAPCKVVRAFILMNRKADSAHSKPYAEVIRTDKIFKWITPDDDSVDLAVTGIGFPENLYEQMQIPSDLFVNNEEIQSGKVVEGDPVLFAGLFVQTFNEVHTLEPIVRSGSLAMLPEGLLPTTLQNKLGRIYLAEAHVFGGNSGSPVFVDPNKYSGPITSSPNYKLIGVISGEVTENYDMTLNVTASVSANVAGNSDVSVVVPVSELTKLLENPRLKAERDRIVKLQLHSGP